MLLTGSSSVHISIFCSVVTRRVACFVEPHRFCLLYGRYSFHQIDQQTHIITYSVPMLEIACPVKCVLCHHRLTAFLRKYRPLSSTKSLSVHHDRDDRRSLQFACPEHLGCGESHSSHLQSSIKFSYEWTSGLYKNSYRRTFLSANGWCTAATGLFSHICSSMLFGGTITIHRTRSSKHIKRLIFVVP